jgi:hypothetical protein
MLLMVRFLLFVLAAVHDECPSAKFRYQSCLPPAIFIGSAAAPCAAESPATIQAASFQRCLRVVFT